MRAPNTSWSPLRGLRYGDTEGLRASCFAGAGPALARFSRCFRVARGRLLHLAMKSSPATRAHPVVPPREGSAPPGKPEVLSAAPRSGERALPVAMPDGSGVGARGAFGTRQTLAPKRRGWLKVWGSIRFGYRVANRSARCCVT